LETLGKEEEEEEEEEEEVVIENVLYQPSSSSLNPSIRPAIAIHCVDLDHLASTMLLCLAGCLTINHCLSSPLIN
jgi:hypothetical protein